MVLTRRGWVLLGVAAALAVIGVLVRLEELLPVAVAAVVLVSASALWTWLRPWQLATERLLLTPRVAVGSVASVELAVRNVDRRRSPLLRARDNFDGGRRVAPFSIAPLEPGEEVRALYRLPGSERGVFALGPIEVALDDPFGLVRAVRRDAAAARLVVHPPVETLASLPVPGPGDQSGTSGAALVGQRSDEFFALRQYQTGDDLRRVHWASSARTADLMIRSDQTVWKGRVTILVDLRRQVHDARSLDAALSAAASLAAASRRSAIPVRIVTTAGADSGEGVSAAHAGMLLDLLAAAGPSGPDEAPGRGRTAGDLFGELVGKLGSAARSVGDASLVVVTTEAVGEYDLAAFGRLGAGGPRPTVVMIGLTGPPGRGRSAGGAAVGGAAAGGVAAGGAGGGVRGGGDRGLRLTAEARAALPGPVVWVAPGRSFPRAWERGMQAARTGEAADLRW